MYSLQASKQHGVAHTLRAEGHDASEDGTGRGVPLVAETVRSHPRPGSNSVGGTVAQTITAEMYRSGGATAGNNPGVRNVVIGDPRRHDERHRGWERPREVHPTLGNTNPQTLAFDWQKGNDVDNPRPSTMNATPESPSLGSTRVPAVTTSIPRRLTPRECERLQGFPDDWTRCGRTPEGEAVELADSPRYRMLGNAVSVPVAEWIGRRLPA